MTGPGPRSLRVPWVLTAIAAGILLVAVAHARSRTGDGGSDVLFWLSVILIVFPAGLTLAGPAPSRGERVTMIVAVGLGLYAIKVLRDPFAFTFGDELAHFRNLQEIDRTGELYGTNSILPVTPRYPGVEALAQGVSETGTRSLFTAGLILIAAARTVFMIAVYLIFERISGSMRHASLAALICTAAPTFLFFSAQFSYESLAVPLAVTAVFIVVRRQSAVDIHEQRRWGALLVLVGTAIACTHHLTSYALLAFLLTLCLVTSVVEDRRHAPWLATGILTVITLAVLVLVASQTVGYLSPVLADAFRSIQNTLTRESGPRQLFRSTGGVEQTPGIERLVALGAVAMLAVAILGGIAVQWRDFRGRAISIIMAIGALAYLATQPLRLVPAAWETANRASSVLFVMVGATASVGVVWWIDRRNTHPRRREAIAAAVIAWFVAGGIIAGWPESLRMSKPYRATDQGRIVAPPQVEAARWARAHLPPDARIGAQTADAQLLVTVGRRTAVQGIGPNIQGVLDGEQLLPWHRAVLRDNKIGLLATDRRRISANNIAGYFFDRGRPELAPAITTGKFDLPTVDRLYDSGAIVVFNVRELW